MIKNNNQISFTQTLSQAGLTIDQAGIYAILLANGPLPAGKIHQKSSLTRGLVYRLLDQLIEQGVVVKKEEPKKVAIFEPAHPFKLQELAEQKEEQAKSAKTALQGAMNQLVIDYNLLHGKPGVQFYEGVDGIKKVYDEILYNAREIKILSSNIDAYSPELRPLVDEQVKKQSRLGITARVIGNYFNSPTNPEAFQRLIESDVQFKVLKDFPLPSQVIVFNDIVALSALTPELVTTIVHNKAIAETMSIIFNTLWGVAAPVDKIRDNSNI